MLAASWPPELKRPAARSWSRLPAAEITPGVMASTAAWSTAWPICRAIPWSP